VRTVLHLEPLPSRFVGFGRRVDRDAPAGFHSGMRYEFVQTYGEISRDKDGPRTLQPPHEPGDWELHSWAVDPQQGHGNCLIVVWKRELARQERSETW
jgi:hypothetical protein